MNLWRLLFLVVVCFAGLCLWAPETNKGKWREHLRHVARALVTALVLYWIFFILPPLFTK